MKKLSTLLLIFAFFQTLEAQVKRYVLIEHFTNSKCPICASKNPAFYTLSSQYPNDIHHVSVHPSFPYNTCVFYVANPTENTAWVNQYGISSTPQVALNGTLVPLGSPMLPQATLEAALNQTSNLYLQVSESGAASNRSVMVKARTEGVLPAGNLRLFVAVLEKTINLPTSNGETYHYNVFRDLLTDVAGAPFTPATVGQEVQSDYNYTIDAAWNPNEVYVLAYVKNMDTGEVINSGTKFDPIVSGTGEVFAGKIHISPNPATDNTQISIPDGISLQSLRLFELSGKEVKIPYDYAQGRAELRLSDLRAGIYLLRITTDKGVLTRKLIKK